MATSIWWKRGIVDFVVDDDRFQLMHFVYFFSPFTKLYGFPMFYSVIEMFLSSLWHNSEKK